MRRLALVLVGVLALTGCAPTVEPGDDGVTRVVASTDVYGDIVATIGGVAIEVTSIVDNPDQDPHSVEVSARVQLAISKADLLIENGGGYDDWMDILLAGSGNDEATVLNVTDLSGYDTSGDFNEHLWYDMNTMAAIVTPIVKALVDIDPSNAEVFQQNAAELSAGIAAIAERESEAIDAVNGAGVIVNEPLALYMLEACGFVNLTPAEFSDSIEAGTDMSPVVMRETVALIADGKVAMVVYNSQTSDPKFDQIVSNALDTQVPLVAMSETLGQDPSATLDTDMHFVEWMNENLDQILYPYDLARPFSA